MGGESVVGRGGHGRTHVIYITDPLVHDLTAGDGSDSGAVSFCAQNDAAGGCGGPLRGGGALVAVGHRHAVLPLGGAEVAGGHGSCLLGESAGDRQRGQRQ